MNRITWTQVAVLGVVVVLVLAVGIVVVGSLWGGGYWMMGPGMMDGYRGSTFNLLLMLPMLLLFLGILALLIVGVVWLVRVTGKGNGKESETAQEILKIRYAKGELSKEEFDQMKNDI